MEGLLCDVTLVPGDGDEVFPVHRAMMASASDYFKAMFTGGVFIKAMYCCLQIALIQTLRHKFSAVCDSVHDCKQHCGLNISFSTVAYGVLKLHF